MTATVLNELLDLMLMQNMPDTGFEGIHLNHFFDIEKLDEEVLERFIPESKHLQ